ncbi:transglutaminase-like domain-containing protein [Haloimpatiens sp. FM7315]|uniref:transglutaminase-like domain-containing protein n=1 Tax=Haloimpatiens sp. FM7315 TaxID=3298609 RepID=UPI0039777C52
MGWIKKNSLLILCVFINGFYVLDLMKRSLLIKKIYYGDILFWYIVAVLVYWFIGYLLKKKRRMHVFLLIVIAITVFGFYFNSSQIHSFIKKEFVDSALRTFYLINAEKEIEFRLFKYIFILCSIIVIPLILWISSKFMVILVFINFSLVNLMWFLGYTKEVKYNLNMYLFVTLFSLSVSIYSKRVDKLKQNNVDVRMKKHKIAIYACIFSIIISTVTVCLPQKFLGKLSLKYGSKLTNEFSKYNANAKIDGISDKAYNFKSSGYSGEDKKLGGKININNKVAFSILGDRVKYLKGSIKDTYTGDMWKISKEIKYIKGYNGKKIIANYKFRNYDENKVQITVKPEEIKTTSLFVPSYTYKIVGIYGDMYYDRTPTFLTQRINNKEYSVSYYRNSFETVEEFKKNLLNKNKVYTEYFIGNMIYSKKEDKEFQTFSEDEIIDESKNTDIMDIDTVKSNYNNYLKVPKSVPKRVYELVNKITSGASNNTEKIQKIKSYLSKNYKYTTDTFDLPKGKDFVDYFLFEYKKGYCTYFSSAMCIMSRIAGMPSRYVEGYKTNKKNEYSAFTSITNEEAHAWCEVLVDPYCDLWVVADPSPTILEYKTEKKKKKSTFDYNNIKINKNKNNIKSVNGEASKSESKNLSVKRNNKGVILTIVIFAGFIFINIMMIKIKKRKIICSKSVVPLYKYTLKRLESIDIYRHNKGDLEFARAIKDEKLKEKMIELVEVYYKQYYGNVVDDTFNKKVFYSYIESYIKDNKRKLNYYANFIAINWII